MNKKLLLPLFAVMLLSAPLVSFAATCPQPGTTTSQGGGQLPAPVSVSEWINCIINNLLTLVLWPLFLGVIIIMFIWAGFLFLTAKGEPAKISQATKALVWAVVGIAVGLFAYSAVTTIKALLGIQ